MGPVQHAPTTALSSDPAHSVGSAAAPSSAQTPSPGQHTCTLRRDLDRMFADMEFRARRVAMMNYEEAERYSKWADMLQTVSTIVGALGVSGIGASVAKFKQVTASSSGVAGVLALPLCGVLQFLANGSSSMAPTVGEKARMHVRAGAGWQRIARETRAQRLELKYSTDGQLQIPLLMAKYQELVEACEKVSVIVPIKAKTYAKFEQAEVFQQRLQRKEYRLQQYMEAAEENKLG